MPVAIAWFKHRAYQQGSSRARAVYSETLVPIGKSANYYRSRLVNTLLRKNAIQKELTEQKNIVKWAIGSSRRVLDKLEEKQLGLPPWVQKLVKKRAKEAKANGAAAGSATKSKGKDTEEKKSSPIPEGHTPSFHRDKAGEWWPTWVKEGRASEQQIPSLSGVSSVQCALLFPPVQRSTIGRCP